MNLPVIDIPVQLPFEVPVLLHPVFVHFAIAIPVIAFLLELANMKAKNRAVSLTSLFLLTLGLLVYAGLFFTGKADGSHAWASLSEAAKGDLESHKLLGIYLVYSMAVLFLFKLFVMLMRTNWVRDFFLILMLLFIGVLFKQGKDGSGLVYQYGVNVHLTAQQLKRTDTTKAPEKAKAAAEALKPASENTPQPEVPAVSKEQTSSEAPTPETETSAPSASESAQPASTSQEAQPEKPAGESAQPSALSEAPADVKEAVESVKEAAKTETEKITQKVKEEVNEAVSEAETKAEHALSSEAADVEQEAPTPTEPSTLPEAADDQTTEKAE